MNLTKKLILSSLVATGLAAGVVPSLAMAGDKEPEKPQEPAKTESAEPMTDAWITTKVKADLVATKDVPGLDIRVETVNGMVKLTGQVANQMQKNKAVEVAMKIKGVKSVDADGLAMAATARTK